MDPFVELTTKMSLLTQKLRVSQIVNEHHQTMRSQVQNPQIVNEHHHSCFSRGGKKLHICTKKPKKTQHALSGGSPNGVMPFQDSRRV